MKEIVGTSNRILDIDLSTRSATAFDVSEADLKMFLGGKGLGLKYLGERLAPGCDPLGPQNILAFMLGVLMGTGAPCSGRFAAVTKSPLTGIMTSSSCGGPFGMACKSAGYDGLLVTGCSDTPLYLEIKPGGVVEFKDAAHLWGKDVFQTQDALVSDRRDGALVIGPAGENGVRYANIASGHRFLGRGGMGAVMGAKRLKALVARGGAYKIVPRKTEAFDKVRKKALGYINANRYTADLYRNYGTNANTLPGNAAGFLPVHNFTRGSHEKAAEISGQAMKERYRTRYATCKPCSILCGHKGTHPDGSEHHIPEYETVGLLGMSLGIFDTERISLWNDICCRMGLDTISAGATLAWVMEAGQKGIFETDLAFGSPEGVAESLEAIAYRRGQGDELANGTRWLSRKYGGREFAIQVKGLEMAAYDPRAAWGQGLSYAVANRGACHLSGYLVGLEIYEHLLNPHTTRAKPEFTRFFESLTATVNSLHTCLFTLFAYTLEPPLTKYTPKPMLGMLMQYLPRTAIGLTDFSLYPKLWSTVTGIPMSSRKFLRAGDRIHVLERHLNSREGISRKDDTLPPRLLREARSDDPLGLRVPLEPMLDRYYRLRGYNSNGVPTAKTLKKLGLSTKGGAPRTRGGLFCREVKPKNSRLKQRYLAVMLWFFGRAVQAVSRVDREAENEVAQLPEGFTFSLGIAPRGPFLVLRKDARGRLKYLGGDPSGKKIDLRQDLKHASLAMLLFTFQENTIVSATRDRMSGHGELFNAGPMIRIFNIVNVYLLPGFVARRAVKRYPVWSRKRRTIGRVRVFWRTILGY